MAYIFKGNLRGFHCDDCFDYLAEVKVKLYNVQDNATLRVALASKETFHQVNADEIAQKQAALIAETTTDAEGNFTFKLDEGSYKGAAFDVDFECGTPVPGIPKPPKRGDLQFHITTIQPVWRGSENDKIASWEYAIPERFWCFILSLFDIWTICGRVINCETKKPVVNVRVKAFDSDLFVDDYMGSDVTDSAGHFKIQFPGDNFRQTIIPGLNIEFPSGPDVYFWVETTGTTPVALLKEPSSAGNIPARHNIGSCLCVELCVDNSGLPPENFVQPLFTHVGSFKIQTDSVSSSQFDANGLGISGALKYAFTQTLPFIGDLPNGTNVNAIEFRFRVFDINAGGTEISWTNLKANNVFTDFQIGVLQKFDGTNWVDVPRYINLATDADAAGWIAVPRENVPLGIGTFIHKGQLGSFDTTKLVAEFFDLTTPTVHVAGNALASADKFAGPDHVYQIIFEARDAVSKAAVGSNVLSKIVLWNGSKVVTGNSDFAFRAERHPSWAGGTGDFKGVCMLDVNELRGAGCKKITTQMTILCSIYHPYLESASLSITGPGGTTNIALPAASSSGEIVQNSVYVFTPKDPDCAYILDLSAGYRLTNGNAIGGGSYFDTDRIGLCKSSGM